MEYGNGIDISDGRQWSFENNVASHFDDHVKLSVPLYDEGHDLVCYLSDFFMGDDAVVYEIGCSTGTLINKIYNRHHTKRRVTYIGIEPFEEMIVVAREKSDKNIEFIQDFVENIEFKKCNLILSYYCMQFIAPQDRIEVYKKMYNALTPGSALILFEKEIIDNSEINKIVSSVYLKFKINNGFNPDEVLAKQFSLEGVMKSNTHCKNKEVLEEIGFESVETVMKYGEFNGYLCIK